MQALVITGTGTGVGKTVVCAALAALAAARGLRVAVLKPTQSGVAPDEPGDVDDVRRLSGVADCHELARFREPLAPGTAARRAGGTGVGSASIAEAACALRGRDLVLIEGAGGALVRLDDGGDTILDVAALLRAPVIVVARAGLGTLSDVALTCEAVRARRLRCAGVIVGAWPTQPDLAARCNLEDLPAYAGAPLLGRLPVRAGRLDRTAFLAAARTGLDGADGVLPDRPEVHA